MRFTVTVYDFNGAVFTCKDVLPSEAVKPYQAVEFCFRNMSLALTQSTEPEESYLGLDAAVDEPRQKLQIKQLYGTGRTYVTEVAYNGGSIRTFWQE